MLYKHTLDIALNNLVETLVTEIKNEPKVRGFYLACTYSGKTFLILNVTCIYILQKHSRE